jgi:hypothetical protein
MTMVASAIAPVRIGMRIVTRWFLQFGCAEEMARRSDWRAKTSGPPR